MQLENHLSLNERTIQSPNLTGKFTEDDLKALGAWVCEGFDRDYDSCRPWRRRVQAALDLAQQVVVDKTFPWPGAANVAFPLVTIAAMQFHARAYPAIVNGEDLVKYRILGGEATEEDRARGQAIVDTMNYQLLEEDQSWEEQEDRLLLVAAIAGTAFKKTYYNAQDRHPVSEMVMPSDLVLAYDAKSVEGCPRKTHVVPLSRNEIYERVQSGVFRDVLEESWYQGFPRVRGNEVSYAEDKRRGLTPPPADELTPFQFFEQHCWVDLDGDGYAEPYIITVERDSKCVCRIVSRIERKEDIERKPDGTIIRLHATEYFTKRGFIPSPDGGIFDIGFGTLLGPINETVSTAINQLLDQGTMSTLGGGFLGRGAKIRGGAFTFSPGQWLRVDSTGEDLSKSLVPLPLREPSGVMFQLLGLLIDYSNRISASVDIMVGENPGQNTKTGVANTMIEQGMKIYSAIFKRQWRGLKQEFKKIFQLNAIYLLGERRAPFLGDPNKIVPAADPNVVSDNLRVQQAVAVKQAAMTTPGYDREAVERNYLKALKVDEIDALFPGAKKVPPLPNPKMALEQMKLQMEQAKLKQDQQQFILTLQNDVRLNQAKILELHAKSAKEISEAKGKEKELAIAEFNARVAALNAHHDTVQGYLDLALQGMNNGSQGTGFPGMAPPPSDAGASQLPPGGEGGM